MVESNDRKQITRLLERIKGHCFPLAKESPEKSFKLMVAGMPNVGKSTIINRLRAIGTGIGGKAVRTGGVPGITRLISEYVRISSYPKVYLVDTPGVLMPKIIDPEVGLKIALTGGMLDRVVGDYLIAEYFYTLLLDTGGLGRLKRRLGIDVDCLPEKFEYFLPLLASKLNMVQNGSINTSNCIGMFLRMFRFGELGRFTLDSIPQ